MIAVYLQMCCYILQYTWTYSDSLVDETFSLMLWYEVRVHVSSRHCCVPDLKGGGGVREEGRDRGREGGREGGRECERRERYHC